MDESAAGRYTVKELADRGGVTPRTIYYYVSEGLLPPPERGGPATTYRDEHLARLRLIRRLKEEYLPLAEIRRRLAGLSAAEVEALLDAPPAAPPTESAREYLARVLGPADARRAPLKDHVSMGPIPPPAAPSPSLGRAHGVRPHVGAGEAAEVTPVEQDDWRRVRIGPDVELHVRRDAPPAVRKNLQRMVEAIRRVLET